MESNWRSITAGILNIVSGVGMLFVCFWLLLAGGVTSFVGSDVPAWLPGFIFAFAIPFAVLSLLAIIGGILSVTRKSWGMALTGSIAAFFCCFIFGIVSIILIAIGRSEFK